MKESNAKSKTLASLALMLAVLMTGCTSAAASNMSADAAPVVEPPAAEIELTGSVTALPVMLSLADSYNAQVSAETKITPSAIGKDASIESVSSGTIELAMFEGSITDLPQGTEGSVIAYGAVAVVMNPSSGTTALSSQQLTSIFSGEITDWSEVGGSGTITLVLPDQNDTFRVLFEDRFELKEEQDGIMRTRIPDTATISSNTAADVLGIDGAIGICSAASLSDLKNAAAIDTVVPSEQNIRDGLYPAIATIILAKKSSTSSGAARFLTYCQSEEASDAMRNAGFIPAGK